MRGSSIDGNLQRAKIWDPVSRLWHWVFAVAVVGNWLLGNYFMSFDTVRLHFYIGIGILALLVFRLVWGLWGPAPVRFSTFMPTPSDVKQYLGSLFKREPSGTPGHNPLGALSVIAMLAVVAVQASFGLFIRADDFFEAAPLHPYVSDSVADFLSDWHHTLPVVILVLVVMHVAAIVFYRVWKREDLITPMIHGRKWVRRK